jgi:hypothetical protein
MSHAFASRARFCGRRTASEKELAMGIKPALRGRQDLEI